MALPPFKRELFPYAIVVLLACIGFALPLPILPEMFLDPERSILPADFSIAQKTMILSLLMTAFPLGQFFGSPLLGRLSDRIGRKKVILFSLVGSMLGYLITALSTEFTLIPGIFTGLLVCGFSEGNIAVAESVIADLTPQENQNDKIFQFGWINLFICLGFIIGPLIGGVLADPHLVGWFTFATPFWIGLVLTVGGFFIILMSSKETKAPKLAIEKQHFLKEQLDLLRIAPLRLIFFANFFIWLSAFSFWRFFPVYLERIFDFSSSQLAYVMVYESVAFAFSLIFLMKPLSERFSSKQTVVLSSLFFGLMLIIAIYPATPYSLILTLPFIGALLAIMLTNASVLVSNTVKLEVHGQAMGTLTSVQVLAELLSAIVGGVLAVLLPSLPVIIGGVMAGIGALFLLERKKRHV